jgi:hypothetical protein
MDVDPAKVDQVIGTTLGELVGRFTRQKHPGRRVNRPIKSADKIRRYAQLLATIEQNTDGRSRQLTVRVDLIGSEKGSNSIAIFCAQ